MADQTESMSWPIRSALLVYLLLLSILLLYLIYSIWEATPPPASQSVTVEPDLTGQPGPEDGSPKIIQIDPETVVIGSDRATVRIFGHNFQRQSAVRFDDVLRPSKFVNPNQLVISLVSSDFSTPGRIVVHVVNDDQSSDAVTLLVEPRDDTAGTWTFFNWERQISQESRLLLLVIFTGAFGASIIALQSFADYRGDKKLGATWAIFYLVRPPIGGGVAFVFYLVIRGGFLAGTTIDVGTGTPYGIAAVSALVGMFSDKAILKLNEVFANLFKADDDRLGKLGGLAIDDTTLPDATAQMMYNHPLKARRGKPPYKWTVAPNLPAQLKLDADTGLISGTPAAAVPKAKHKFTVTDADGATATVELELEVK